MNVSRSPAPVLWMLSGICMLYLLLTGVFGWNAAHFVRINRLSGITGDWLWANLTVFGDAMIICALLFPFARRKPDLIVHMVLAAIVTTLCVQILKSVTHVDRPARILDPEVIHIIGRRLTRRAFPSGHTATIFTLASVSVFYMKRAWMQTGILVFAGLVGLSRIVVGAHWPADVAGGAFLGLSGGVLSQTINRRRKRPVGRTARIVWAILLGITTAVLLIDYNTHYPRADLLKYTLGGFCLIAGGFETFRMFSEKEPGC